LIVRLLENRGAGISRREFLFATTAVGGGLWLGFRPVMGEEAAPASGGINPYHAYLRIDSDSVVTVLCAHMEGGQGVNSGVATLLAEELGARWDQVRVESAAGNPEYYGNMAVGGNFQLTGGSTSMVSSWHRYREAGAAARIMLMQAAADAWGAPAAEITISEGLIHHASGRSASFGEFANAAADVALPEKIALKPRNEWVHIGNASRRRSDTAAKINGTQDYTIDVDLPGMLTAVIQHPPRFGGTVKSVDATAAKAMSGVIDVVTIERGVAVVAKSYWQALQARAALKIEWDESAAETRGTTEIFAEYRRLASLEPGVVALSVGDASGALNSAERILEAEFEFPYLAHAAMEPLNAVAQFKDGSLQLWGGLQLTDLYQHTAAKIMGIEPHNVQLHPMMAGGFFGRRATPDSDVISEVVSIVRQLGSDAPVKLQYGREDDMQGGYYRPLYLHRVTAGIDAAGMPLSVKHHIVGQSIIKGTMFESTLIRDGIDISSVEGAFERHYAIPNVDVRLTTTDIGVPVLWWRSVGSSHNAYVTETLIDDLAHAAGKDPVSYREQLLAGQPRHLGVLRLASKKAGWNEPLAPGRGRGVAVHKSFGTYVAQVAEVTMVDGMPRVDRVVCAVDCGVAINPDTIVAQMEGGIGFALGAILDGAITMEEGRVVQSNYDTFSVLRMNQMPSIEVFIVPSDASPTGVGEPGVPPLGPAVSNAILAAGGDRIRKLPFSHANATA
jgi:isoquinoline 1-oxidoreductase beta subunit